jgi:hypothetical protein
MPLKRILSRTEPHRKRRVCDTLAASGRRGFGTGSAGFKAFDGS